MSARAVAWAGFGRWAARSAAQACVQAPGNPAPRWVAWAANVWFLPAIVILPLLFPYGRLPSRRWLPALWLGGADRVWLRRTA